MNRDYFYKYLQNISFFKENFSMDFLKTLSENIIQKLITEGVKIKLGPTNKDLYDNET